MYSIADSYSMHAYEPLNISLKADHIASYIGDVKYLWIVYVDVTEQDLEAVMHTA